MWSPTRDCLPRRTCDLTRTVTALVRFHAGQTSMTNLVRKMRTSLLSRNVNMRALDSLQLILQEGTRLTHIARWQRWRSEGPWHHRRVILSPLLSTSLLFAPLLYLGYETIVFEYRSASSSIIPLYLNHPLFMRAKHWNVNRRNSSSEWADINSSQLNHGF